MNQAINHQANKRTCVVVSSSVRIQLAVVSGFIAIATIAHKEV
jgi:hypothetical protein